MFVSKPALEGWLQGCQSDLSLLPWQWRSGKVVADAAAAGCHVRVPHKRSGLYPAEGLQEVGWMPYLI